MAFWSTKYINVIHVNPNFQEHYVLAVKFDTNFVEFCFVSFIKNCQTFIGVELCIVKFVINIENNRQRNFKYTFRALNLDF